MVCNSFYLHYHHTIHKADHDHLQRKYRVHQRSRGNAWLHCRLHCKRIRWVLRRTRRWAAFVGWTVRYWHWVKGGLWGPLRGTLRRLAPMCWLCRATHGRLCLLHQRGPSTVQLHRLAGCMGSSGDLRLRYYQWQLLLPQCVTSNQKS